MFPSEGAGAFFLIFYLILAYLVLSHWQGANSLFSTGVTGGGTIIKDLQGR